MSASGFQITTLFATQGLLSEGPRWHEERQELLWVDILACLLHRGRVVADELELLQTFTLDRPVGAVAPVVGGGYILAAGPGFLFVDEDGGVRELPQPAASHHPEVRMNDAACDFQGRFWAGTMAYDESPGAGTLYRLELDGSCETVLTELTISNGV